MIAVRSMLVTGWSGHHKEGGRRRAPEKMVEWDVVVEEVA
jgi:hypothetical protein